MIKILFFASLKEQLSIDALDFPLTESMTVAQLVDELVLKEASIDRDILSAEDILVAVDGKDIHRLVNVPEIIKSKLKKGPLKLTFIRKISNV